MAGPSYPLAYAIKAVKSGMSGRAGLAAFRAGGGKVADATWYRTMGEVRRSLSDSLDEASRPLNRRPTAAEITPITTPKQAGYIQQLSVFVRDKETGEVTSKPFTIRGRGLLTRQKAIAAAVEAFENGVVGSPDQYDEEILGAAYENTLELRPRETQE